LVGKKKVKKKLKKKGTLFGAPESRISWGAHSRQLCFDHRMQKRRHGWFQEFFARCPKRKKSRGDREKKWVNPWDRRARGAAKSVPIHVKHVDEKTGKPKKD